MKNIIKLTNNITDDYLKNESSSISKKYDKKTKNEKNLWKIKDLNINRKKEKDELKRNYFNMYNLGYQIDKIKSDLYKRWLDKKEKEFYNKLYWSKLLYKKDLEYDRKQNILEIDSKKSIFYNIDVPTWKKEDKFLASSKERFVYFTREHFEEFPQTAKRVTKLYTTTFRFKHLMKNYDYKNLFAYEISFFYKHRLYLGYEKELSNNRNDNYLLGYYLKTAIIDAKSLLLSFKSNLFLINKIIVKKHLRGFLIGETNNDIIEKGVINVINYFEMGYYYGRWWNGFFRNYKIFSNHSSIIYRNYSFYDNLFPGYIFFIGVPESDVSTSLYSLNKELCGLCMPSMMFFDTRHSTEFILSPALSNNKTYYYFLFYIKIIICMSIKGMFLKKVDFIKDCMDINKNFKYFKKKKIFFDPLESVEITDEIMTTEYLDNLSKKRNLKLKKRDRFTFFYDDFLGLIIKKKKIDMLISKLSNVI